jgi:phosphatidate phosphatase APP1
MSLRDDLRALVGELASQAWRAAGKIEQAIDRDPYHVVGYRGYGTAERVLVLGRVLQNEGIARADPAQSRWRNLLHALKRFESDPLPFARVRARIQRSELTLVADDEGFVREHVTLASGASLGAGWHDVALDLTEPNHTAPTAVASVLVPPASAQLGVISDMDDTVLQSQVTNFLRAARMVLLENARTRLPFPGVAAFYRALQEGATGTLGNPIFYVSSSPWNLYDVIADFLDAQRIPTGPLLLRDWDLARSGDKHGSHKAPLIRDILETYPTLPFVLVGDSGQEDPEIYTELVRQYPGRILAVYIRNVTPGQERSAAIARLAAEVQTAGSALVLADDTLAAARHAAEHGWIRPGALDEIGGAKADDEGKTGAKVDAPGVDGDETGTIVVE